MGSVSAQNLEPGKFSFAERQIVSSFHDGDVGFCSEFEAVQIPICWASIFEQFSDLKAGFCSEFGAVQIPIC
ncbi:MAG TPA: hypothetical protein GXZ43_06595 [Clostridiaceae bacterium]|nr:hypothetical protein [Clostridiaceae bacterium]